jgi:ubiquinone/menaquinone biosynthesis C-methylase UbiE
MSDVRPLPVAAGKSSFDLVDQQKVFSALDLHPGTVMLDVACGAGLYALAAAEHVGPQGAVYAVDLWAEGIDALREEATRRGLEQIRPLVSDVGERIPVSEGSVDACLLATVLHDLAQVGKDKGCLREIARVLCPGGHLVVVEFNKIDGPPGPPRAIRLSPQDVVARLEPFGFRRQSLIPAGSVTYLMDFVYAP